MTSRQLAFVLAGAVALVLAGPAAAAPATEPKALRKHTFPVNPGPLPATEKAAWSHAPFEAGDCSICHVSADPRKPGPLSTSGNALCYSCHDEFQEIMRRTYQHPPAAESCLNCHNAHNSRERRLLHTELATGCKDCHRQIKELAENSRVKHGALEQGAKCANCHNPHGTWVEKLLIQLPFDQCVNCHAVDHMTDHDGVVLTNYKKWLEANKVWHAPVKAKDCSACHRTHGGENFRLLVAGYPTTFYAPYDREQLRAVLRLPQREGGDRAGDAHPHQLPRRLPQPALPPREQGRPRPHLPRLPRGARLPAAPPRPRRRPLRPQGLDPEGQLHEDPHRRAVRQDLPRDEALREVAAHGRHRGATVILGALGGTVLGALWPMGGLAFANVEVGQQIENEELPTLGGSREMLLSRTALANVFVFFRPGHDRSLQTLRAMAGCEKEFESKPVRWVAIVSDSHARDEVRAVVAESGIHMPVLVDQGDRLYGKLGVRLHPVVGIADEKGKLLDYVPFHQINYCDMIRVRIRHALHEVDLAAVERVDHPPKALFPSAMPGAVAMRRVKLGEMFLESSQWTKAAEQARIALEKEPGLAAAHALLGRALAGQGKCDAALPAFDQALELDPGSASAAEGKRGCEAKKVRRHRGEGTWRTLASWRRWGPRCSGRRPRPAATSRPERVWRTPTWKR